MRNEFMRALKRLDFYIAVAVLYVVNSVLRIIGRDVDPPK